MTDQTETPEQPQTLKVFTCYDPLHPTRSCYALVEDAEEPRRKHREWHADRHAKDEGQRKAIKARDEEIARLHEAVGEYKRAAEGFEEQVRRVETPTAAVPLVIDRSGYAPEEVAGDPEESTDEPDDDWGLPIPTASAEPADPEDEPADDLQRHQEPHDSDLVGLTSEHDYPTGKASAFGSITRDF